MGSKYQCFEEASVPALQLYSGGGTRSQLKTASCLAAACTEKVALGIVPCCKAERQRELTSLAKPSAAQRQDINHQ